MPMQIYTAGAWQRLRDAFDLKGKHNLLLDEVVVPVAVVADLSSQAPDQANDATIQISMPAIVGDLGAACIGNLGTPNVNLLVDKITFMAPAAAATFRIIDTNIAPILGLAGAVLNKTWNDPSQVGVPAGTPFANEDVFGAGTEIMVVRLLPATPFHMEPKWVVPPGRLLIVGHSIINTAWECTFNYRVVSIL